MSSDRNQKTFKKEIFDMKKILTGLLALVMLMSSVIVLSSCAKKPELDLEDAKKALEEAEYSVNYVEDSGEPGVVAYLSARKQIESDDEWDYYTVYIVECEKSSTASLLYKNMKMEYDQQIESLKMEIKVNKHMLKTYEKDMKSDEIKELEDDIKDLEKELEEYKKDYVIGKSGKYVWYGDAKAIEATK